MGAELDNIPQLDGWVNLTEAAEMLGITRQHAFKKARQANDGHPSGWKTIRRIGTKPMYVIAVSEIEEMTGAPRTDLVRGTLSQQDRQDWLRNYGFPDDTTDEEILMAIGSGLA
ncbi:MAG: hypothetical protein ACO1N6_06605 [Microcella sp.]